MQQLQVVHIPQVPGKGFTVAVETLEEARDVMDILANYDLHLEDIGERSDYSNAQFLEVYEDGEWVGWMDDNTGIDDVHEYFDHINEH